jgi:prepilin-type N-terminal cleavage/methylation domain-containing protein
MNGPIIAAEGAHGLTGERQMKKQSGFTLVEIAIVLVIIGLLLGGVLKGQELINQAKIKNLGNDINGLSAAIYGYQDRFKKLPGDDNAAVARWSTATTDGNGNGVLEGCYNGDTTCSGAVTVTPNTAESLRFWQHLRLSGFVGGNAAASLTTAALPQNAVGGYLGVQSGAFGNASLNVCSANLPGKLASALDASLDDGIPNSGQVRAAAITVLNSAVPDTAATNYVADDSTLYVVCKTL